MVVHYLRKMLGKFTIACLPVSGAIVEAAAKVKRKVTCKKCRNTVAFKRKS